MTRVSAGEVEAVPVVADLDEHLLLRGLDPNLRGGRAGMPQVEGGDPESRRGQIADTEAV